jgi:hypothetical protein
VLLVILAALAGAALGEFAPARPSGATKSSTTQHSRK